MWENTQKYPPGFSPLDCDSMASEKQKSLVLRLERKSKASWRDVQVRFSATQLTRHKKKTTLFSGSRPRK